MKGEGEMNQAKIDTVLQLSELAPGKHHFTFRLEDGFFQQIVDTYGVEKSEVKGGDVSVEADLVLRESDYTLHLRVAGEVKLVCDRCLGEMRYAVDAEDDISSGDEADDPEGNTSGRDTIDLRWLAYETITINLPLVHSHPEGECMQDMQQLLQSHLCSTMEEPE